MRKKTGRRNDAADRTVEDIQRRTYKRCSVEKNFRIVLVGVCGKDSIAK